MALRKYLLIPQLAVYSVRAPRDQRLAWDRYWSAIGRAGPAGEVFWQSDDDTDTEAVRAALRAHADLALPLVDVGCGQGRQTAALLDVAPRVLGIDHSPAAVAQARTGVPPDDADRLGFRVADAAEPGLGERLHAELGDANVNLRGLLHVVTEAQRAEIVASLAALLGARGTACVNETDVAGDPLDCLLSQGATATSMPGPLRRLIAAGLRPPSHFGREQVARYFPPERFRVLAEGPVALHGVPLRPGGPPNVIPGYHAVVRAVPAG